MSDPLAGKLLLTLPEVVRALGYQKSFLYEEVDRGRLQTVGRGRARRFVADSVRAYVAALVAADKSERAHPRGNGK